MSNPRETYDMISLYLVRKKDISKNTTDQRTIQLGNGMNKITKTIQQILAIIMVVALRS